MGVTYSQSVKDLLFASIKLISKVCNSDLWFDFMKLVVKLRVPDWLPLWLEVLVNMLPKVRMRNWYIVWGCSKCSLCSRISVSVAFDAYMAWQPDKYNWFATNYKVMNLLECFKNKWVAPQTILYNNKTGQRVREYHEFVTMTVFDQV